MTHFAYEVDAPPQQAKEAAKILKTKFFKVPEW
jgi:hypothetical protein